MVTFILNLMPIIAAVILLSLSYMYKKKINKTDCDKFNLRWCSTLGIVSLGNGIFGIIYLTSISEFIYVYYVYIILNIAFLTLSGIFAYKTLKLLNTK